MLYSIFVLVVGVYIGQEFNNIPSIKQIFIYFRKPVEPIEPEWFGSNFHAAYIQAIVDMFWKKTN
jgi:hypothetical protein